ncbi:MAG: hypothetical protein DCF31_00875 [Alphaproteobacteria bacterium]|nr:MAG: hypothetical protein DCF31_00875 [Alphaproteobacteria bacterium]
MATYTYIPFPEAIINDTVLLSTSYPNVIYSNLATWESGAWKGNDRGHFIKRGGVFSQAPRPLAVVGPTDRLIVSAHGLGGNGEPVNASAISCWANITGVGRTRIGIQVTALAARMKKDGLTKSIADVRLMVCFSGMGDGEQFELQDHELDVRGSPASETLAANLARALGALGYSSVVVAGAVGTVSDGSVTVGYDEKLLPRQRRYSMAARSFDAQGQRVA